jgi:retinol dehydrogenase 12
MRPVSKSLLSFEQALTHGQTRWIISREASHQRNMNTATQKVALITGASSGIGRVTAEQLAALGFKVFLACRSEAKARPVLDAIAKQTGDPQRAVFLPLELGDLDSVRECARNFLSRDLPLQLLINNAGLAGTRGMTKSGFEMTFGVCHVGHFLLTSLLLDRLKASATARIINVSSKSHLAPKTIAFENVRQPKVTGTIRDYEQAKLANVLFTKELARRLQGTGVTSYALHPGVVATDVWRSLPGPLASMVKLFMISEEEGARTTLYCATDPGLENESGYYYAKSRRAPSSPVADDPVLANRLWDESERWVAQKILATG